MITPAGTISINIATIVISVLLAFNTLMVGMSAWFLKRYVEKNDKEHDVFWNRSNDHETRMTVIEKLKVN